MKKVKLPIETGFMSKSISYDDLLAGKSLVSEIDFGSSSVLIQKARENGAHLIYSTISLESKIDELISTLLFSGARYRGEDFYFFKHEILEKPSFNLSFKNKTLFNYVNQFSLLNGKNKNALQEILKYVVRWRNAFAHGEISYREGVGVCLSYYEGGKKLKCLDDAFWDECELKFSKIETILNELAEKRI